MKSFIVTSISLLCAVGLFAQSNPSQSGEAEIHGQNANSTQQGLKPIDSSNFDTSIKPADDFFFYANGGWIKRTEIPPEYTRWGSFNELIERNNDALHAIAEKSQNTKVDPRMAPETQKVGDFYASGMDEKTIEALRTKPLDEEFNAIAAVNDRSALLKEVAHLHSIGIDALFNFGSHPDSKDSTHEIAQAAQGGLGLPDRDYYTKTDEASKKLRDQYVDHVAKMLTLLGDSAPKAQDEARKILALETKLAQASRTRVQLRDPQKNYNKMSVRQLQDLTPDWNWNDYFKAINLLAPQNVNVHQPEFFKTADQVFKETPLDDFKAYLRWHLIDATASDLSKDFVDEDFNFKERILRGAQQIKPRWKRVVASADGAIGEALGKLYVAFNFPPEAKARALEMVDNLKEALADRIKTLEWMDQPTKEQALKKLAAMQVKIGYPDKWLDYSLLSIDRGPYVLNDIRASQFATARELNKIGKPVDPTDWGMTPPTVNAYYQPNRNEIVFPAGILQPPFFYANADDAVNYGAIGAVIGHEMTHGFDDQGRQFDASGNLRDWWSTQSAKEYDKRRKEVVAQYNAYEALPGLHVNGELTQGENIADIGGVKLAYAALQKALAKHPEERTKKIDGFTPEQRFFLSFAAIWRSKIRDEDQKLRLNTDPHSPAHFRVNGPLSDLPEFQQAFNVPDGSAMVRTADKRVNIW
jgi:predicted metalloendopeptidase